jgi:hypothetical protein
MPIDDVIIPPGAVGFVIGFTRLHLWAHGGNTAKVQELLQAGAMVDKEAADKWTPLMHASQKGHLECVKALLAAGADVNKETPRYGPMPIPPLNSCTCRPPGSRARAYRSRG